MSMQKFAMALFLFVAACSRGSDYTVDDSGTVTFEDTKLIIGPCMFVESAPPTAAPIVALLATAAITAGIDVLRNGLEEAGKAGEKPDVVSRHANLYTSVANFPPCIQVIRGKFQNFPRLREPGDYKSIGQVQERQNLSVSSTFEVPPVPDWFQEWPLGTEERKLEYWSLMSTILASDQVGLKLLSEPEFFMEGYVRAGLTPEDTYALRVAPTLIVFNNPINNPRFSTSYTRTISVGIGVAKPGDELKTPAVADLGRIAAGQRLRFNSDIIPLLQACNGPVADEYNARATVNRLEAKESASRKPDSKGPPLSSTEEERLRKARGILNDLSHKLDYSGCLFYGNLRLERETPWFKVDLPEKSAARTAVASVTEIRDAQAAQAFLAATLSVAEKAGLSSEIAKSVVPSLREAQEQAQLEAILTQEGAYFTAVATAIQALHECVVAADPVTASQKFNLARSAVALLRKAATASGQSDPVQTPLNTPQDCGAALVELS